LTFLGFRRIIHCLMVNDSPLLPVYRRSDTLMVRGEGAYLYDDTGKEYLDFASGIATNVLGHHHPALVAALHAQADTLWHCSNLFRNQPLEEFAALLCANSFAEKIFFCSAGTEAVEAAIKTIRRFHYVTGNPQRTNIIAFDGAFHGRTTGALAACASAASKEGFMPLMGGFSHVPFHDIAALEFSITPTTAAVMLETIQGEGGVREHSAAYLQAVRHLCDAHGILMFLDEIQCGYGRTGQLFAYEASGVRPDIVTCAKGIGGGFPLAAMLATNHAAQGMTVGTHGSTYGSNPLACAVGLAVLGELLKPHFFPHMLEVAALLRERLEVLAAEFPHIIKDVRGRGMMLGLELAPQIDKHALAAQLREAGLLTAPAVTHCLRILPPLVIGEKHVSLAEERLKKCFSTYI
jgi:acetylornithine/N-succinyldiaminopimelate aminotransferase